MNNWPEYIHRCLKSDLWGFVALDYFWKCRGSPAALDGDKFVEWVIDKVYCEEVDPVDFHRMIVCLAMEIIGSVPAAIEKSVLFCRRTRRILTNSTVRKIAMDYAPYGKEALLLQRLKEENIMVTNQIAEAPHAEEPAGSNWEVFICHAGEDKDGFVRPLADALSRRNVRVWYDEFVLELGDSLREKVDEGLRCSRWGVVVLSIAFFGKRWPQAELDALVAREGRGTKVVLPVWHGVTRDMVEKYSPLLAGKASVSSEKGIEAVVEEIYHVIEAGK